MGAGDGKNRLFAVRRSGRALSGPHHRVAAGLPAAYDVRAAVARSRVRHDESRSTCVIENNQPSMGCGCKAYMGPGYEGGYLPSEFKPEQLTLYGLPVWASDVNTDSQLADACKSRLDFGSAFPEIYCVDRGVVICVRD